MAIVKKSPIRRVKSQALLCTQNNHPFYLTILSKDVLRKVCTISRRDDDPEKGFQRSLNNARAKNIAKYLDEYQGSIPTALIISVQKNASFSYDQTSGNISFIPNKNSFMVLDGQHRLWGIFHTKKDYDIPVVLFSSLSTSEEVSYFIDINTNQKGVPRTLLLDIKNLTGKEDTKEKKQRELFNKLNTSSVMAGLMSPAKSQVGKITRVSFNQATNTVFDTGFFQDKDIETVYKGVSNYLEAVEKVFKKSKSEKAKLTNSTMFRAVFSIFNEIIDKCFNEKGDLKPKSIESILEPIATISFDNYTGTSNATLSAIITDMKAQLNDYERKYMSMSPNDLF